MPAESSHPWLAVDPERAIRVVEGFLTSYTDEVGADGFVIGLSGGLDSATTAALAVESFGADKVTALFLPGPTSSDEDEQAAEATADALGLTLETLAIGPATAALGDALGDQLPRMVQANLQARLRMALNYARAQMEGRLVLGTGNKSELLTGYFTKHGDGGVDLLPIGDLYKTQVREIARELEVPVRVLERAPTAGLWAGQTDEDELGLPYATLDVILAGIEQQFGDAKIADQAGVDVGEVGRVRGMVETSWHKRNPPPVPKLGWRTVGVDWREPTS